MTARAGEAQQGLKTHGDTPPVLSVRRALERDARAPLKGAWAQRHLDTAPRPVAEVDRQNNEALSLAQCGCVGNEGRRCQYDDARVDMVLDGRERRRREGVPPRIRLGHGEWNDEKGAHTIRPQLSHRP